MTQSQIEAISAAEKAIEDLKRKHTGEMCKAVFNRNKLALFCDHKRPDGSSAYVGSRCTICNLG